MPLGMVGSQRELMRSFRNNQWNPHIRFVIAHDVELEHEAIRQKPVRPKSMHRIRANFVEIEHDLLPSFRMYRFLVRDKVLLGIRESDVVV